MMRREFITLLGGAATWPLVASAQQSGRVRHVGLVTVSEENDLTTNSNVQQLHSALHALGWMDGKNIRFTYRSGGGNPERARIFAKELIELQPDLIVAHGTPIVAALQQVTRTLPIVFASILDPVLNGFALGREPGGGWIVLPSAPITIHSEQIIAITARNRRSESDILRTDRGSGEPPRLRTDLPRRPCAGAFSLRAFGRTDEF